LPDGIFLNQKSQVGGILEGLAMEDVGNSGFLQPFGIFCGHLVCFKVILVYFSPLWYVASRKI
jgi:hypothetical protein